MADHLAGLPSELVDEDQEAKQFDLLMLRLQLAILRHEPSYDRLRKQVSEIVGLLEEKAGIPMILQQIELIQEIQSDEFWQDVTTPILENVRKRLRSLVTLIEKGKRIIVYPDFQDTLGDESTIELPGFGAGANFEKFRAKARQFLKANENHATIQKLRYNALLTRWDIQNLETMLLDAGAGTTEDLNRAKQEGYTLDLFLRALVGLDRKPTKRSFDGFLLGKSPTANQIEFITRWKYSQRKAKCH